MINKAIFFTWENWFIIPLMIMFMVLLLAIMASVVVPTEMESN